MRDLSQIWVYLSANPLLHLTLTLLAYQAGMFLYLRSGFSLLRWYRNIPAW